VIRQLKLLLLVAVATGACAGNPTPAPTSPPADATTGGYPAPPAPTAGLPEGYPGALTAEPTPIPEPTPTIDPTLGIVEGVLLLRGQPISNHAVYLGAMLKDEAGQESVVALDLINSPWSTSAADGSFQIVNVAAGRYGLVLVTMRDSYHLLYPDRNESVIVTVVEAGHVDLGVLDYPLLPILLP
jgi:hypothetical protein